MNLKKTYEVLMCEFTSKIVQFNGNRERHGIAGGGHTTTVRAKTKNGRNI
jgi:hypothetical protein